MWISCCSLFYELPPTVIPRNERARKCQTPCRESLQSLPNKAGISAPLDVAPTVNAFSGVHTSSSRNCNAAVPSNFAHLSPKISKLLNAYKLKYTHFTLILLDFFFISLRLVELSLKFIFLVIFIYLTCHALLIGIVQCFF